MWRKGILTKNKITNDFKYWLALSRLKGIERVSLKDLLKEFGSPRGVFTSSQKKLSAFSDAVKSAVRGFDEWDWVEREIGLVEGKGARLITFDSDEYPLLLREAPDPPSVLYAKGLKFDNERPCVSVVGTRHPTPYGIKLSGAIAGGIALAGVIVASGMAMGCDAAAHTGALDAGGFTVAVLGTGVDVIYPRECRRIYEEVSVKGLVLSEFPMSTPPQPYNFPKRNRIISGLSLGVVVVEAPLRSGALMTARLALEAGRDVLAVPGPAMSHKSAGTNRLIKEGAPLVESAKDVLDALAIECRLNEAEDQAVHEPEAIEQRLVWGALGTETLHIDGIMDKTGLKPARVCAVLLDMELKGIIEQRPGKFFARRVS
ncbi:MAG: DNA-processing protein DprA [Deltaproteobacteria bacterium]